MNRSRIAEHIVSQVKVTLKKPKRVKIVYFDMIKTFLKSLVQLENDVSRQICLKHLHWLLIKNEENLAALLDDAVKLTQFVERVYQYELDVVQKEECSGQSNSIRTIRVGQVFSEVVWKDASSRLFSLIRSKSPLEEELLKGSREQQSSSRQRHPIKSLTSAQEIINDLLVRDLERPPHLSMTFQLLEEFPDTESVFHYQVLTCLIRHF